MPRVPLHRISKYCHNLLIEQKETDTMICKNNRQVLTHGFPWWYKEANVSLYFLTVLNRLFQTLS